ncbi:MAG: hypothetical protein JSS72_03315 [Armatimonadetes bacterium]|nr:hypothetical protein [Armatimonadota bacterium]
MAKTNQQLSRITITMPPGLVQDIEHRLSEGQFASISEWIRYAIREQLRRDAKTIGELMVAEPQARESYNAAVGKQTKKVNLDKFKG